MTRHWARVALDFKAVKVPALIASGYLYLSFMQAARLFTPGRFWQ